MVILRRWFRNRNQSLFLPDPAFADKNRFLIYLSRLKGQGSGMASHIRLEPKMAQFLDTTSKVGIQNMASAKGCMMTVAGTKKTNNEKILNLGNKPKIMQNPTVISRRPVKITMKLAAGTPPCSATEVRLG